MDGWRPGKGRERPKERDGLVSCDGGKKTGAAFLLFFPFPIRGVSTLESTHILISPDRRRDTVRTKGNPSTSTSNHSSRVSGRFRTPRKMESSRQLQAGIVSASTNSTTCAIARIPFGSQSQRNTTGGTATSKFRWPNRPGTVLY